MPPAVVRAGGGPKGGWLSGSASRPELAHVLAEGVEAQSEALGDILLATAVEEDGAQGLVEALRRVGGVEEERATRGVVHNQVPGCESFRRRNGTRRIAESRRPGQAGKTGGSCAPEKAGPKGRGSVGEDQAEVQNTGSGKADRPCQKAHTEAQTVPRNPGTARAACEELRFRGNRR